MGERGIYDPEFSYNIPVEVLEHALNRLGIIESMATVGHRINSDSVAALRELLPPGTEQKEQDELLKRMLCESFLFVVRKT